MNIPERNETNKNILVVDDDLSILHLLESGLQLEGFYVRTAESGEKAIQVAKEKSFQFLITDLKLPDFDGLELGRIIKGYHPNLVVILMTGYPGIKSAVKAIQDNIYDYLIKPFMPDQVFAVLERAVHDLKLTAKNINNEKLIDKLKAENKKLHEIIKELAPKEFDMKTKLADKYKNIQASEEQARKTYDGK